MKPTYRVLTTGSRGYTDKFRVSLAMLDNVCHAAAVITGTSEGVVVIHGGCPDGADALVADWCKRAGIRTEVHLADWDKHGKAAGPIRNREMVDSGADVCVAFWDGVSKGTLDTITKATLAGIIVQVVPAVRKREA